MNYGEKITELRKSKGMTQTELGEKLNVAFQTISKWERGESVPDLDMMFKISKLFGVPITYFDDSDGEVAEAEAETAPAMLGVCTECGRVVYEGGAAITHPVLMCKDCRDRRIAWNKSVADEAKVKKQKERSAEAERAKRQRSTGFIVGGTLSGFYLAGGIAMAAMGEIPWADFGYSCLGELFVFFFICQLCWKGSVTRTFCGFGVSVFSDHIILLILFFGLFIMLTVFGFILALITAPISFWFELLNLNSIIKNGKPRKKPKAKAKKK
ncbi:MAG: helix-turn-helix domain-containing protein [Clostridia bacterium]|nr:helix-turn-helix domain-containing protein [Clostridia bacterium]